MIILSGAEPALAEFKVRSPIVDFREFEFEHNGSVSFDRNKSGKNNNQSYTNEIGVGLVPNWFVELEGEFEAPSGENLRHSATTIENYFQLTPQGKYWADLGLFAEYSIATHSAEGNALTIGPLVQKEAPGVLGYDSLHTLNVLFTHGVGSHATGTTPLFVAWQSRLRVDPLFEPGFEYYGETDNVSHPGKLADQQHRIGPVVAALYRFPPLGKIKLQTAYLFGLTRATENGTVRWRLEYEVPF